MTPNKQDNAGSGKKKSVLIKFGIIILLLMALLAWSEYENNSLVRTDVTVESAALPAQFNGYKIAQLSDLHEKVMGPNNSRIIEMVAQAAPDIIVITGDLVEGTPRSKQYTDVTITGLLKIAPVYFVSGNNDVAMTGFAQLKKDLAAAGVTVLDDRSALLERGGSSIIIAGLPDPNASKGDHIAGLLATDLIASRPDAYKVVLAHRPQYFKKYADAGFDLVLSGHAHGGQIRLPVIGAVYAPGEGLFPKYTAGLFTEGNTTMFVNRGIGNSAISQRILNKPEIAVITLKSSKSD